MSPDSPPSEPVPPAPLPKRSRLTRLVVVGCGLGIAAVVLPRIPRERQIEFQIDDPTNIVAIDLTWARDDGDGEPVQGGSWRFTAGQAPRKLLSSVHLPSGRYAIDASVERTEGRNELHRVIELSDADRITIPLR